jgi:hypothetical protein
MLCDHLGVCWDAGMLEPGREETPILTASALRVRRPFSGASIGGWRRVAQHAVPLLEELGDLIQ